MKYGSKCSLVYAGFSEIFSIRTLPPQFEER